MNRDDTIRMAREAGWDNYDSQDERLERFFLLAAAAGAAAEREACAQAARTAMLGAEWSLTERVMRAIRARGEKK